MSDRIKIEVDKIELNLILWLLEERIRFGDDVEKIRVCLGLIDRLGDILLKENSVDE